MKYHFVENGVKFIKAHGNAAATDLLLPSTMNSFNQKMMKKQLIDVGVVPHWPRLPHKEYM